MRKVLLATLLALTPLTVFGQAKPPDIKSTPAADALNASAKDLTTEQAAFDKAIQQARSAADLSQKQLVQQLTDANKALSDKLKADKKYSPDIDHINTLQKQLQDLQQTSETNFQKTAGPVQAKIQSDRASIDALVNVVRKENGLADSSTYDPATQTWKR